MTPKIDYADKNLALIKEYRSGNLKAKDALIQNNMGLVSSISQRFCGRGTELEDLTETGVIGLLKAIEGFDENMGCSFSTYAFPLISGEIKRYLRDDGQIKISRITKRNAYIVLKEKENYIKKHGKEPKISELSEICGLSQECIVDSLNAAMPLISLQDKVNDSEGDLTIGEMLCDDDKLGNITDIIALRQSIEELSEFEKNIINLRFFRNFTQNAVAKILGTSQVTISRAEKKIIDKLRQKIL